MTKPNLSFIYEKLLRRSGEPLPGYQEMTQSHKLERALKIYHYLLDRSDRMGMSCLNCSDRLARKSHTRYVFDTPWDDEESEKPFCSDDCGDSYLYEGDFAYFTCGKCEREICEQNPRNGWHIQYRDYDGQMTCLKCYQDLIIENGVEREKLEEGFVPGMFFSFGNPEPLQAGYKEVDGFKNFYIRSQVSSETFRKKGLELMDQGKKVVIGYESLGIGGGEGYVTLMEKDLPAPKKRRKR